MTIDEFTKLFDGYSRVARLYPATLALVPAMLLVAVAFPETLLGEFPKNVVVVLAFLSVLYLLASAARAAGKDKEPALLRRWGGWPTTTMLRHADRTIDRYTKARYHAALAAMCPELVWPSAADEAGDPADADAVLLSATNRLKERRRGPEHKLVHKENASYGFRRNMLGLKPFAIVVAMLAAAVEAVLWTHSPGGATSAGEVWAKISADPRYPLLVFADLLTVFAWSRWVRDSQVRRAAEEYGRALLRSLDVEGA